MRIGISIAVVVAIGLIWSVAVMSEWIPMASAELMSAAVVNLEGPAVTGAEPVDAGRSAPVQPLKTASL